MKNLICLLTEHCIVLRILPFSSAANVLPIQAAAVAKANKALIPELFRNLINYVSRELHSPKNSELA